MDDLKLKVGDYFSYSDISIIYQVSYIDHDQQQIWTTEKCYLEFDDIDNTTLIEPTVELVIQSIHRELNE